MPASMLASLAPLACTVALLAGPLVAFGSEEPVSVTFTESYGGTAFAPVTAVGLRAAATATTGPADVLILVDTSASQTGRFRALGLEAVTALLAQARPEDRFLPAAIDVSFAPLGEGFAAPASPELRRAVLALDARTPLGSTDLIAGLESAVASFADGDRHRAIVYVGDGPALAGVDPADFARVVTALRAKRISVSSLGIGPYVNWPCLAALAAATGGVVRVPGENEAAREAGATIGAAAIQPVAWPEAETFTGKSAQAVRVLPSLIPPLRADRDSILLVVGPLEEGQFEFAVTAAAGRRDVKLDVRPAEPRESNAHLFELARNAWDTGGLFLPLAGRESLDLARQVVRGEAATLAALSRQAEASGAREAAVRLAEASLRRDPDNPEAAIVRAAVLRTGADEPAPESIAPPPEPLAAPPASDGSELAEVEAMRRVRGQQLERETAVRIREARQLLATDPDRARDMLKESQLLIERSDDFDVGSRDRLLRQLEMRIRESIVRSREKVECDLAAERRAAIGRERMRLNTELQAREERIKQLVERYNALVEEGIREGYAQPESYPAVIDDEAVIGYERPTKALVEAERVVAEQIAKEAPPLWANHPVPMTARVVARKAMVESRILEYDAQNFRTRRDQERGFMDCLHLVDVAGIPFPDEPPIIYPTRERWAELTRKRAKYKSVDLANPTSTEKQIYEALEEEVTQTFDFQETPLRAAIEQLQDAFNIAIVPDMQALTDAGIDLDGTTVTQKLSGVSLRSALRLLLRDAGLTYLVKDEVLLITTKEKAQENLVVKVYPVADLVLPVNPSSGLNPFQTGGGLGGQNSVNSGMGQGGGGGMGGGMGGMGGFCWVAREVYGPHDPRWLEFRDWMMHDAPVWLRHAYATHGEAFAAWIHDKPAWKLAIRGLMDAVLESRPLVQGGLFQVADARDRVARRAKPATDVDAAGEIPAGTKAATGADDDRIGLPQNVVDARDLRAALAAYLESAGDKDPRQAALRMAQVRVSAQELGRASRFDRAADLIAAALACGRSEPWMYESLALALEAAGRPRAEVERALLSSADFAAGPTELLQLANYLARFGSPRQAIRVCRQVARLDPANREAYALAMTLAAREEDAAALRWACPGVLAHEWPADQREIVKRATRLAKAAVDRLGADGKSDEAAAFQADVDRALVRDLVVEVSWTGDADIDLLVEEPPGTVCSAAASRSTSGGVLLADGACAEEGEVGTNPSQGLHRERYVATEAFPGTYRVLVRRAWGRPAADTVTAETVIHRGTDREQRQRKQIQLGGDESLIVVNLGEGRRREPLFDAQIAQDVAVQRQVGKTVLAQQLASLADPTVAAELSASRGGATGPQVPGSPFFGPGAVGYQPIVSTLPEGINLFARAVVSADRRYVRITATPLFSGVGQVTTFNWQSGNSGMSLGGGGGMAGGGMGGGGMGGMGGGGMGGMGGGGMGGGGMGGGMMGGGGMGGGGMGGGMGGGGMGMCWVAREVYGVDDSRWLIFRDWLLSDAPGWLRDAYGAHGEAFAKWIHDKPVVKRGLRVLMDRAIAERPAPAGH
jgi:hypothetical protein